VNAEFWPVITMGIVILIAIATSNRSLRREMGERIDGLGKRIDRVQRELNERIDRVQRELNERIDRLDVRIDGLSTRIDRLDERIDGVERKVSERLGEVRERLGRVEGMLEAVLRMRTGKGRGDEKHDPALPRS